MFSIGTLRQKRIRESHTSEGIGHDPNLHRQDESFHKTLMEEKEAAEKKAHDQHLESIHRSKQLGQQARQRLAMDDDLEAQEFDTLNTSSVFESFKLGQDESGRDRGHGVRAHRTIRVVAAETSLSSRAARMFDDGRTEPPCLRPEPPSRPQYVRPEWNFDYGEEEEEEEEKEEEEEDNVGGDSDGDGDGSGDVNDENDKRERKETAMLV